MKMRADDFISHTGGRSFLLFSEAAFAGLIWNFEGTVRCDACASRSVSIALNE